MFTREQRAEKLRWVKVPSEDDPAGWCWLLPHGSTRGSGTAILDAPLPGEVVDTAEGDQGRPPEAEF